MATEVIAVSIGPKAAQDVLRTAMAMGVDKAIHIETDVRTDTDLQPLAVAKTLAHIAQVRHFWIERFVVLSCYSLGFSSQKEKVDLVLVGKQSIDSDNGQVAQMLAGLLSWPQGTFASAVNVAGDKKELLVDRETDQGMEQINLLLPAVLSADLRLNTPRYATLPNIMKAKKKPIEVIDAATLGIEYAPQNKVTRVEEPAARKAGIFVDSVDSLLDKLRNEAKVI